MSKFKASLLAALGLLILTGVISVIGPQRALAMIGFTPVREVDSPGRQPFSIALSATFNDKTFNVPSNKRLIITYVDAITPAENAAQAINILSKVTGGNSALTLPFTTDRAGFSFLSQQVMGFADPETTVIVNFNSIGTPPNRTATVNIHGYYINLP